MLTVIAALWPMAGVSAQAQPEVEDPAPPPIALADDIELAPLVDFVASRLGLNIEYDASVVQGSVSLRLGGELSDAELWALTNRLLATHQLTTVRVSTEDTLSVVRIAEAASLARVEGMFEIGGIRPTPPKPRAGFEMLMVRARFRPVAELTQAVSSLLESQAGKVATAEGTALITISGLTPRVDTALELLERLDVPGQRVVIESVEPAHVSAESLQISVTQLSAKHALVSGIDHLGEVLKSVDGGSLLVVAPESELEYWRDLIARLDRREPVETLTYAPRHFGAVEVSALIEQTIGAGTAQRPPDDRFRVIVDELTGSLIVTATAAQHARIGELMSRLDAVPPELRRAIRRYVVRNRSADDLLGVLSGLIEAGVLDTGTADGAGSDQQRTNAAGVTQMDVRRPPTGGPSGDVLADRDQGEPDIRLVPQDVVVGQAVSLTIDSATNTLIAIGEPRMLDQLGELIDSLDTRQPQVRLEVVMVSLSESDSLDLAVQLEKLIDLQGNTTLRLMSLFGLGPVGGAIGEGAGGSGLTGAVLNPGEFSAVIRALETVNKGRALSRPYVLVGNNQQATFDAVVEEPFVSVNASNTVATTSFGGAVPAGTVITVTPTIASGDHLELEYSVSLSSFVGESSDPSIPPPRQESKVASVATIPDGYTIVVGGIETITEGESVSRVPILGSIPLIGELFTSRATSRSRSRFFVFIRADVMRGPGFESLKYASDLASGQAGIDDGWPVVEPRIIR